MAHFIKFTETANTARGQTTCLRFVNVEHIIDATWDEQKKELQVCLLGMKNVVLHGNEAADAQEVLKKL